VTGEGIDAILRARMQSSRLSGKVLMPAAGKPLLLHLVERLRRTRLLKRVVVATSEAAVDDAIAGLCAREDILCFRGSNEDVLDRYYRCAKAYGMAHIAVLYADNPLLDPGVCDESVAFYLEHLDAYDYVSNCRPSTYPDGQEIEMCSFEALQTAWKEAGKPFQREHVTPFIWDQPERFRCFNLTMEPNLNHRERWTLDYPEDYEFILAVFEGLYPVKPDFSMWDLITFLDAHPDLRKTNAMHGGSTWFTGHEDELKTVQRKKT
jgi:spore coat polysaccharide biosynthesis protein SpsF